MALDVTDIRALRDAEKAHTAVFQAAAAKAADPSVAVVKNADGTTTAFVRYGGKFREVSDVTFLDMGAKP
jgi:hypothetical protein